MLDILGPSAGVPNAIASYGEGRGGIKDRAISIGIGMEGGNAMDGSYRNIKGSVRVAGEF